MKMSAHVILPMTKISFVGHSKKSINQDNSLSFPHVRHDLVDSDHLQRMHSQLILSKEFKRKK